MAVLLIAFVAFVFLCMGIPTPSRNLRRRSRLGVGSIGFGLIVSWHWINTIWLSFKVSITVWHILLALLSFVWSMLLMTAGFMVLNNRKAYLAWQEELGIANRPRYSMKTMMIVLAVAVAAIVIPSVIVIVINK